MKKLIAILVVFAVVAGAAFAQVPTGMFMNAWGQGAFTPLMIQTPELKDGVKLVQKHADGSEETIGARTFVGVGPEWGWNNKIAAQFNVGGSSEGIGWSVNVPVHDAITGNIWAKPFNGSDAFKITIGNYTEDTLRSGMGGTANQTGTYDWVLPGLMGGDNIFGRLGTDPDGCHTKYAGGQGFMFTSVPVNGLFLAWNVNVAHAFNVAENYKGNNRRANDAFRHSQAAVGYNISGIGLIRVMYNGGWGGKYDESNEKTMKKIIRADGTPLDGLHSDTNATGFKDTEQAAIQAAFALTALDAVKIDLGYKFFIPVTLWKDFGDGSEKYSKSSHGHWLAAGAEMNFGIVNFRIFAGAKFGAYDGRDVTKDFEEELKTVDLKKDRTRKGLDLSVKIDPSFSLDFGTIGISLGYNYKGSPIDLIEVDGKYKYARDKDKPAYSHQFGAGVWYERSIGSGQFTVALTYTTPQLKYFKDADTEKKLAANGSHFIQVPITLTYAFF